ncbi:MAG TPA: hypothetical protein VEK07_23245 [Polyangiaceae bacterium]|nr:hypothetical protein [Polyangiaceae bacterium]
MKTARFLTRPVRSAATAAVWLGATWPCLASVGCTTRASPSDDRPSRAQGTIEAHTGSAPDAAGQAASGDAGLVEAPVSGDFDEEAATLTLLDPGASPRRKLRYAWRSGLKEELTLELRTFASTETSDAQTPGIPLPPVRIVIAIDAVDVSADGDLHYAWRVTAADVLAEPQTPDQLSDGMRAEVAVVAHVSGDGVTSSSGIARRVTIDPGSAAKGAGTGEMVEQIDQTLRNAPAPFPDEPIGLGARWQRVCQVASRDAHITQTDTFVLVGLSGGRGTLDDVLAQTAPPQVLRTPGMRSGDQARMESMLVSGSAKTHFDLAHLVPRTQIESTTTMVVSGHAAGAASQRTTMVLRVSIALAGRSIRLRSAPPSSEAAAPGADAHQ